MTTIELLNELKEKLNAKDYADLGRKTGLHKSKISAIKNLHQGFSRKSLLMIRKKTGLDYTGIEIERPPLMAPGMQLLPDRGLPTEPGKQVQKAMLSSLANQAIRKVLELELLEALEVLKRLNDRLDKQILEEREKGQGADKN